MPVPTTPIRSAKAAKEAVPDTPRAKAAKEAVPNSPRAREISGMSCEEAAPHTPRAKAAKEVVADSPSTKASTTVNSEPASPAKISPAPEVNTVNSGPATPAKTPRVPEVNTVNSGPATPAKTPRVPEVDFSLQSADSTRANTALNSTLTTPRGGRKQSPGYTAHSVLHLSTFQSSPRYTFRPPARDPSGLKVPGPGSYETPRRTGRTTSMVSGRRPGKGPDETPGPGTHEKETAMGTGLKYSMGRSLGAKGADVPGPGKYETRGDLGQSPKYTVGLPREGTTSQVPGPGTYNHESYTKITQNPQYSVPCSPRSRPIRVEEVPGPGAHARQTHVGEGPKFSLGVPRTRKAESTPGPGDYGGLYTTFHTC